MDILRDILGATPIPITVVTVTSGGSCTVGALPSLSDELRPSRRCVVDDRVEGGPEESAEFFWVTIHYRWVRYIHNPILV